MKSFLNWAHEDDWMYFHAILGGLLTGYFLIWLSVLVRT